MKNAKDLFIYLPTFGILVFIMLFVYSTSLYPGGSQADINSVGFDWANNFWCNLMSKKGLNGLDNPASPIAILATILLGLSMTLFFFLFAKIFVKNRFWKLAISISGPIAMFSAMFIFTKYHDIMTTLLSVFGALVIIGMLRTLHLRKMTFLKISGIICLISICFNNLFYYNENLIEYLPVIQKCTFVLVLAWTIGLNLKMKNKEEQEERL